MNEIQLSYIMEPAAAGNSPRVVDIAERAAAAARELVALGNTPSERRLIAAIASQAIRRVFAEVAR